VNGKNPGMSCAAGGKTGVDPPEGALDAGGEMGFLFHIFLFFLFVKRTDLGVVCVPSGYTVVCQRGATKYMC